LASAGACKFVNGLTVGTLYYFQVSLVLKDGIEGIWSQTMSVVVR